MTPALKKTKLKKLKLFGLFLYYIGAINLEEMALRLYHPLIFLVVFVSILIAFLGGIIIGPFSAVKKYANDINRAKGFVNW